MSADRGLSVSLGTANDEINVSATAFCAPQPGGPIRQRQPGTVALDLFGDVGLNLVPTRLAPND
jgi:hypothetical protein